MLNSQKPYDAVIVGGGIAGLTAAAYLVKDGYHPLLIEQQDIIGGLVNSFLYKGFVFDGGIRSIESSGVLKPMIRDLNLDVQLKISPVTLGIQKQVISLNDIHDLKSYHSLLVSLFPENEPDIHKIVKKIHRILKYMDVLYGIENPMIIDLKSRPSYVIKTLFPWFFKFVPTLINIERLSVPVETYLRKYTSNQNLIDMIAQHFFKGTPTFFALGYFSIYFDYHYPLGGTGSLPSALEKYITSHGGTVKKETKIQKVSVEQKTIQDTSGQVYPYRKLIWAADLNALHQMIDQDDIISSKLKVKVNHRIHQLQNKTGAESVLTVYALTDLDPDYFRSKSSGHFFYTPKVQGLSRVVLPHIDDMTSFQESLDLFLDLNTYEISIPVLRDETLAPPKQTGLIISVLMTYDIIRHIESKGFYPEFKSYVEKKMIEVLSSSIYPDLSNHILETFCSTPLSFQKRIGSTDGAIIGWAYTNQPIPVPHHMSHITKSIQTYLPDIYQAGQWSFSPAGVPISVITGKLAADATKCYLKKNK
jgi:phytoene dehydrogenase-like protein